MFVWAFDDVWAADAAEAQVEVEVPECTTVVETWCGLERAPGYSEQAHLALSRDERGGLTVQQLTISPIEAAGEWIDVTHMLPGSERRRLLGYMTDAEEGVA